MLALVALCLGPPDPVRAAEIGGGTAEPGGSLASATQPVQVPVQVDEWVESDGYRWRVAFELSRRDAAVQVACRIALLPVDDVSRAELDRVARGWESVSEALWSGTHALVDAHGRLHPILVDVRFTAVAPQHRVIVRRDP
ncbi:MAG: hypothetical protein KDK91_33755, partial [Gammaproteobacteria bacterium]|nr:hypothetical protein [Gammaproteobacteria bacterium]